MALGLPLVCKAHFKCSEVAPFVRRHSKVRRTVSRIESWPKSASTLPTVGPHAGAKLVVPDAGDCRRCRHAKHALVAQALHAKVQGLRDLATAVLPTSPQAQPQLPDQLCQARRLHDGAALPPCGILGRRAGLRAGSERVLLCLVHVELAVAQGREAPAENLDQRIFHRPAVRGGQVVGFSGGRGN
eukprot:scaffold1272_cov250-Pinguiococcus_pyrenoidosus.AAC.41